MTKKRTLYVTSGEQSGDMLGAGVIRHILEFEPEIRIKGIGGKEMRKAGMESVFDSENLGFMGFFELIRHTFVIRKAFKAVLKNILKDRPAVILMIDFSEFHIKLAKKIKNHLPQTKIIKYVSPQIWASRSGRIKDIVKYYDCLCCILPFETEIYADHPLDCRYVGHPLADRYELKLSYSEFYDKFRLDENKTLISIFPGSRLQEIRKHMSIISEFTEKLLKKNPDIEIAVCLSGNLPEEIFDSYNLPIAVKIVPSKYQWEVMSFSGIVLCKSGTSTLQTAVTGTPSVVFYRVNPLSYFIAKRIVKSKYISLPNIIAQKEINPELIQSEFTPENLIKEVEKLLNNEDIYELRKKELEIVKRDLGGKGAAKKVAETVIEYLNAD
jgi:lipid-A-disaccharide synthase